MKRLKDLREDKDLTQAQVAEVINCTQTCYSKYELNQRDIPNDSLIKLAHFYNTSTDYILGITDEIKPYPKTKRKTTD